MPRQKVYNINEFNLDDVKQGSTILVIGRRRTGKSEFCRDLMSRFQHCKSGLVICPTERKNPFWSEHVPQSLIHIKWDPDLVYELFHRQEAAKRKTGSMPPLFAIFDDLMFDRKFMRSDAMREIFMNGRHSNITTVVTTQYLMDVPPAIRTNLDLAFAFKDIYRCNRERIFIQIASVFDTFEEFDQVMKACTLKHECMVIRVDSDSYNPEDSIFCAKAVMGKKYKLCDQKYWNRGGTLKKKRKEKNQRRNKKGDLIKVKKNYINKTEPQSQKRPDYAKEYMKYRKAIKS